VTQPREYYDPRMVNRMRLFFAVATRRQLERWEPIVAVYHRDEMAGREPASADLWSAEVEHHFALIAARNLIGALDMNPATSVSFNSTLRKEVIEGRDLCEHWKENMPVFNVTPRIAEPPRPSGQAFAARNPDTSPYWWLGWNPKTGAWLMPNVHAPALHELLDAVEAEALAFDASWREYVPPRAPSPWDHINGEWWPKPA
jgi:hypothetical protein